MSSRLGEWGSNTETEGHLGCEGITQQPGPFYNGNFSSSIWGNPPTPPLWRDMPSPNVSCSTLRGQPLGFDKTKSKMSCKIEPSDKQEEKVSKRQGDFSFRQQARPPESLNSPFSFGFPPPPPLPSSSSVCDQSTLNSSSYSQSQFEGRSADATNGNSTMFDNGSNQCFTQATPFSLKELSSKWGSMLQPQDGLNGSFNSQSPLHGSYVGGVSFSEEVTQPIEDADMHAVSLNKQQPSHIGNSSTNPDLLNCNRTPPLFSHKGNSGTFVFGSCPASGTSVNIGFSLQKEVHDSAAGILPRSSITNAKVKKHSNFVKRRTPTASVSRAFQQGPSKPSVDPSCFSNSALKFTMGVSDEDCSRCREPGSKNMNSTDSEFGPASGLQNLCASAQKVSSSFGANMEGSQTPLFFAGAVSTGSRKDTESVAGLSAGSISQQRSETKHARTFGKQFDSWHPFLQREENPFKTCGLDRDFVGVASSEETPYLNDSDRNHQKWEASVKTAFSYEELPKPSIDVNRTFEGSKLAEFNLNSPGNLLVEDLRERAPKWGRSTEEIRRQKENQEPNFLFGSQKATRPFVFGASRTSGSMKHATLSTDDMHKKERSSKGNKESKALEHLIAKLGEKMANLGKSGDTQSDHAACIGETKEFSASVCSSEEYCKRLGKEDGFDEEGRNTLTNGSQDAANIFEKKFSLNHSINELREQIAKLGRFDNQVNRWNDKTGKSSCSLNGASNSNAIEHAVEELCEQIANLGNTVDKATCLASESQQSRSHDSSAVEHAVEELREQITKLGTAVRDNNQEKYPASGLGPSDIFEQSVEELRERMVTFGKADEKGNSQSLDQEPKSKPEKKEVQEAFVFSACNATTRKESDFCWSKAFTGSSGAGFVNTAQLNPFTTESHSNLFPSNVFAGAQSSSSFPMVKPFTAGQPFMFSASEMSSASNDTGQGCSPQGFEFPGTKATFNGTTMQRRYKRFNIRSRDKGNLTRLKKSSVLQPEIHSPLTAHSAGSPMDFSPCADKCAPLSQKIASNEAQQAPVQTSPEPNLVEAESVNVEELRMATSNLTVGNEDRSSNGDQFFFRSFEHSTAETNPFDLRQRMGKWKRALRKEMNVPISTKNFSGTKLVDSNPQFIFGSNMAAHTGACGINRAKEHAQESLLGEEFNRSSFSPLADTHGVGSREKPLRKTTLNQGSAFFVNEKGGDSTQKAANKKASQPFRFRKLDKEQKATSIARENPLSPTVMKSAVAEQVCEKWRLRGNQAYAKGDYEKAEDCYSRGAGSISQEDTSQSCIKASMLCYSNRAATRMAVGRMREALVDCKRAMILDSSFLRVRLRAANCHLALGESNTAAALFSECWKCAEENNSVDMKIVDEAMDGVKKSQQFDNLLERVSKLCRGETSTDASAALHLLNEVLLISPFSEALLELKAQALFLLRKFEDVLQLCQQTLPAAEENHVVKQHHEQSLHTESIYPNLWRWRMCGKSLFHLGRLEESSSLLTKYEEATCSISSNKAANTESVGAFLITIRDLLHHKAAGNEAFQAGRHAEAVEHYTSALACNGESRPYNAVCFCNRAAASQALGHIADAIADCSRAIVLDSHYAKAISRRATLHEIIRDYGQTCNDLGRLIGLLEGQEAHLKSPKSTRAGSKNTQDLKQTRDRLEKATKELKKDCGVDHYLILGLDVSCSSSDIKKAYRKAALKHHPDKAGQFLVRGENGDDGSLWKESGDEVRRDAERLFKLIGESYAILSDPTKRAQYDVENHTSRARNPSHAGYGGTDDNCSPGEKTSRRQRDRRDGWSGYSPRYQRWQNGPDAAQPDTYSERGTRDSRSCKDRNRGRRTDCYWDEF